MAAARNGANRAVAVHALLTKLRRINDYAGVCGGAVDGTISQGWKDPDTNGPLTQQSFDNVKAQWPNDWTPAEYVIDFYNECLIYGNNSQLNCGRALRNLPSFLREDFLCQELNKLFPGAARTVTCHINAAMHIDILFNYQGQVICIWNYLMTPNAIQKLHKKILRRGTPTPGLNLFAPIDQTTDITNTLNWHLPSASYVQKLLRAVSVGIANPLPWTTVSQKARSNSVFFNTFQMALYP